MKFVKASFVFVALSAISLLVTSSHANAITYIFTDVPLTDGGRLDGNFTTNIYGAPATWSLTTSGGALGFPSETYTNPPTGINAISSPNFSAPNIIDFYADNALPSPYFVELHLVFSGNVMNGAALLGGPASFECHGWVCPSDLTRYIGDLRGDEVTVTPLPAALPLFAGGGSVLGFLSWRRKRKARKAA